MPLSMHSYSTPSDRATTPGRSGWVDAAKGLSILLVVMMHAALGVGEAMGGDGFLHHAVAFAKPFRIPAFFLLAGLFLARTIDKPWADYADRKIIHFAYFYLLWAAIQIGLKFGITLGPLPALQEFAHALVEPFGTLWFIYLLPLFFITAKLLRPVPPVLVLIAAALLEMAHVQTGWTAIDEFCARFVWFFAGYRLSAHVFAWAALAHERKGVAIAFVWCAAMGNGLIVIHGYGSLPGVSLLLGACGAAGLIVCASLLQRTWAGSLLSIAGRQSIVIYLAFFLPMIVMRALLIKSGIGAQIGIGATSLLVWLAAAVTPLIVHPLVMRSPLRFLFERPSWARWPAPRAASALPAE